MAQGIDFRALSDVQTFPVWDRAGHEYIVEVDTPLAVVALQLEHSEALGNGTIGQAAFDDLLSTMYALLARRQPELTKQDVKERFTTTEFARLIAHFFSLLRGEMTADAAGPPSEPTPSLTPTPPSSPKTSRRAGSRRS